MNTPTTGENRPRSTPKAKSAGNIYAFPGCELPQHLRSKGRQRKAGKKKPSKEHQAAIDFMIALLADIRTGQADGVKAVATLLRDGWGLNVPVPSLREWEEARIYYTDTVRINHIISEAFKRPVGHDSQKE